MVININNIKAWLNDFALEIIKNESYLNELDTKIGDGDHGTNMSKGAHVIISDLSFDYETIDKLLNKVGVSLITKVGGASGALYGSAFMEMSKTSINNLDLTNLVLSGLNIIEKRGRSTRNEKTMLDIWYVALEGLENNNLSNDLLDSELLRTKDIEATKGRASYLGVRSIGHIDPGSQSSVYLFKSLIKEVMK